MQRKKNQLSELVQLNEELENYFANTIIPQLFVDASLILRKFTPPAMRQFNLRAEYIGKPLEEIKENFRHSTIIDNIDTVIKTGKILEKEIQTTDMRWYQMNILPYMLRKENRTNGVILTFVDITPRITDLKEQERVVAEYELLLDTVAHDVKNPLFVIGLMVEQLLRTPPDNQEQYQRIADGLKSSLREMNNTVNDLVGARWHKERYDACSELLDLQNIIEDVKLALAPQILETGALIYKDLQASEITFVRRKMRSVLYNLVSNAIKYTPEGIVPRICISSSKNQNGISIAIRDNGIGMSEREQEHIFEKFQRIGLNGNGSGVGLYLVHNIISSVGGSITIDSEPGQGTTFTLVLSSC